MSVMSYHANVTGGPAENKEEVVASDFFSNGGAGFQSPRGTEC